MKNCLKLITTVLCLMCCLVFGVAAIEPPEIPETAPKNLPQLKVEVEKLLEENAVPGASIALVDENGPVWIGAIGQANIENNVAADENTLFRIGSTSKLFVGLAVLKLVEQGKLSLTDKLFDLAPEVGYQNQWRQTDPIRVVHLLEHTTGWDDIHLPEYNHNDPTPLTLKQGLDFHPHSRISRWKPGSRMAYCNSGPAVAAYIVEKVSGQLYEDFIDAHFLQPIGMNSSTFWQSNDVKTRGATLYRGGTEAQEYRHMTMRPSGAMNSSASDMAKLLEFFVNRGRVNGSSILSASSLDRMETTRSTPAGLAGQQVGYGLTNMLMPHKQLAYRTHGGAVPGGISQFGYLPSAKVGYAISINSDNHGAAKALSKLVQNYQTRHIADTAVTKELAVSDTHRQIEGLYYKINSRAAMGDFTNILQVQKLVFEGDKLAYKSLLGGKTRYFYPVSNQLYKSAENGLLALTKTTDPLAGDVVHVYNTVLKPASSIVVYGQLLVVGLWLVAMISSIVFLPVWAVRKYQQKIAGGATIWIRLWPLLATVSIVAFVGRYISVTTMASLAQPSLTSISLMLLTIAFAVFAILGVYTAIKERNADMHPGVYWYATCCSVIHLLAAIHLARFGVIGIMTWA